VPVYNFLILAVIMSGATLLTLSPTLNQQFNKLIEMSVLACLIAYIYACAALWRYPGVATPTLYRWLALGAIVVCGWVIAMSGATMLILGGVALALVSAVYLFVQNKK
jgi:amino acid transporter